MVPQTKGKIFLADERGCSECEAFRSHHTFNFGAYAHEHKTPFGSLCVLNDDTLAGGEQLTIQVPANSTVVLLPIVGAIGLTDPDGYIELIEAGHCRFVSALKDSTFFIRNPYEQELVNFLQLWIQQPIACAEPIPPGVLFDIDAQKNQLIPLHEAPYLYIGKFSGREELEYHLHDACNGVFVFVIEGAFEVQYRLLHARDGLALWDTDEIELEALSNDAIILLAEIAL